MGRVNKKTYNQYLTGEGTKYIRRQFTEKKKTPMAKNLKKSCPIFLIITKIR